MLNTQNFRISLIFAIILMIVMIFVGTTAARAEDTIGAQKGTAHYQLCETYE